MPSLLTSNAIPLVQVTKAFGSITSSYTLVGTFSSWVEIMNIINTTDSVVLISFDGTHDHVTVPVGNTTPAIVPFNFKSNNLTFPVPSIYAKTAGSPSTGSISANAFSSTTQ